MNDKSIFFAGGGTAGHIYPAIAIAEKIRQLQPGVNIHFFISERDIDSRILSKTAFEFTKLPAVGFSFRPNRFIEFFTSFLASGRIAKNVIIKSSNSVVVSIGGFVAAPVCWAAAQLRIPIALINTDVTPGRANRIIAHRAKEVFVQFEQTARYLSKVRAKINVAGCPLRSDFENPQPQKIYERLNLDKDKKILLIMGGSSGSVSINRTMLLLPGRLSAFAETWQIVHIAGRENLADVRLGYAGSVIEAKVLDYFDDMADLLSAADLVIGRSGAVSIAEYAASGTPAICMPYPHHRDMHQYLNAGKLVEAGAAVIVDDIPDEKDRADWLWEELEQLLKDDGRRGEMKQACGAIAKKDAALKIAERLLGI